jgi:ABC-2 type transport system ATP-binding protein
VIVIDRISKSFGARRALDGVSFEVRRGEILALLGHNGAGKSTLFAVMLGLLHPTGGDIVIDGASVRRDARRARRRVGSVLAPAFYDYLTGAENLRLLASYSGERVRADEVAAAARFVGLADRIRDRVRVYSHGMRRRLALAQALLPRPDVLLIDEWEAGLDPEGVRGMRDLIVRLNREHGLTIALSSHRPNGVEHMSERVVILRQGKVVFGGRWHDLGDGGSVVRLGVDDWARAVPVVRALGGTSLADGTVALPAPHAVPDLVAALVAAGLRVHAVEPLHASAEERYLRAVGEPPA